MTGKLSFIEDSVAALRAELEKKDTVWVCPECGYVSAERDVSIRELRAELEEKTKALDEAKEIICIHQHDWSPSASKWMEKWSKE